MSHDLSTRLPNLGGHLLLAAPSLRDPNFHRSVVLLAMHDAKEGAFGYVLNNPVQHRVADLVRDHKIGDLGNVPVFKGGPVGDDRLSFAALRWREKDHSIQVLPHLAPEAALDELAAGSVVKAFVGYSGWGAGQLERELQQRSWITLDPCPRAVESGEPERLWGDLLRDMGPVFSLIADTPEHVELN
jgi:putative transcriptional regulator